MENNALIAIANGFAEVMADGFTGGEPFFNAELMREAAKEKLKELEALPEFDLSTEEGRKLLRAAVKPVKQVFDDFEKNIKVIKKSQSEIPKKCDASSKAVRDMAEPALAKVLAPFAHLKAQEALTEKWWKKEGIPFDKYSLERLLQETIEAKPLPYSTEAEESDFWQRKGGYIKAVEEALNRLFLAEKAENEEKERLRLQAEEQRRAREALEAEQRRNAEEKAKVEAAAKELQEQKQREAVNPGSADSTAKEIICAGAPPALSGWELETMIWEADESLAASLRQLPPFENLSIEEVERAACEIVNEIRDGKISHVRFFHE